MLKLYSSLYEIPVVRYFDFKLFSSLFFCNNGVFQSTLAEKYIHLKRMLAAKNSEEDVDKYLNSLYISEIENRTSTSHIYTAFKMLCKDEEEDVLKVSSFYVVEEVKRMNEVFQAQLEKSFQEYKDEETEDRYFLMKTEAKKYAEDIDKGADRSFLKNYFFNEIQYIELNPSSEEPFRLKFMENFTSWYLSLGYKSQKDLEGISAFEFFTKNRMMTKKQKKG